jgi:LSM domain
VWSHPSPRHEKKKPTTRLTHTPLPHPTQQVELKTGETYRGDLAETEDNWNLQLKNVTATARDGRVSRMEHVFVRGAKVR